MTKRLICLGLISCIFVSGICFGKNIEKNESNNTILKEDKKFKWEDHLKEISKMSEMIICIKDGKLTKYYFTDKMDEIMEGLKKDKKD